MAEFLQTNKNKYFTYEQILLFSTVLQLLFVLSCLLFSAGVVFRKAVCLICACEFVHLYT